VLVWPLLGGGSVAFTLGEARNMSQRLDPIVGRRNVIRALAGVAVAAAANTPLVPAAGDSENSSQTSKARYRPDSPEVQTFYRVNRYPGKSVHADQES